MSESITVMGRIPEKFNIKDILKTLKRESEILTGEIHPNSKVVVIDISIKEYKEV